MYLNSNIIYFISVFMLTITTAVLLHQVSKRI